MKSAVVILSMVAAIAAEAPYHLPRPAAHAPALGYPAPAHPRPQPHFVQYPLQSAAEPQFAKGSGYYYHQPNIAPTFVQPAPHPHPHFHAQNPPVQPFPVSYPQQQYAQPQPQPQYAQPQPQPQYAQPLPQPILQTQPSFTYGQPQLRTVPAPRQELPVSPVQPFIPPQPQPQPAQTYQPISYYQPQVNFQQGYSYQQPQTQAIQYTSQLPLQAQPLTNNAAFSTLSSYQADSNQYSGSAQTHSEALDSTVVGRVQNIIKENEHISARDAGYVSLVSGVSLEGARPSIEISSFVQNSPLAGVRSEQIPVSQTPSSQSPAASAAAAGPSPDYGLPADTANSQGTQADSSIAFLPQNKPVASYGSPQ